MSDVLSRPVPVRARRLAALALAVLSALALAVPAAPASARPVERPYALTAGQERTVLRLIDDVCGDTWCEGDHAFRFRRFACDPRRARCTLHLQLASLTEEPLRWHARSLHITGFPRYCDMVRTAANGARSLRTPFYEAVGDAVRAAEATVP